MLYEKDKDKLMQMINEGDFERNSGNMDQATRIWRDIVFLSDKIWENDIEHIDENLLLRDGLSDILFATRRFQEAAECDGQTLARLESMDELRQTELWNMIQNNIHNRSEKLRRMTAWTDADEKRKYKESERRELSSSSVESAHSVGFTNSRFAKIGSAQEKSFSTSQVGPPPSPWINPRRKTLRRQHPLSFPESQRIDAPDVPKEPTISENTQEPMRPPKRSQSVTNLDTHEFRHNELAEQTTVDDTSVPANDPPRRSQVLGDGTGSDSLEERADQWFRDLEYWTHNFIYGKESKYQNFLTKERKYAKIKIAILDTGIALSNREDKLKLQSYRHRIKKIESFLPGEKRNAGNIDESGHGTAVACLLLKVCPNAEIYVARVARQAEDRWEIDKGAVARALVKAVDDTEWKVDIINMSFGWDKDDDEVIRNALSHAKAQNVLVFASTSNSGISPSNDILYPARSSDVIAIDAADGVGNPAPFNPTSEDQIGKSRFTALGRAVKCHFDGMRRSGTSFASPIAAGTAALVLEFARQHPLGFDPRVNEYLKMAGGMLSIFRLMSLPKDASKFKFICPQRFLKGDDDDVYGGNGMPLSRRFFIAEVIIDVLKKEHGGNIGNNIYPEIAREMAQSFPEEDGPKSNG